MVARRALAVRASSALINGSRASRMRCHVSSACWQAPDSIRASSSGKVSPRWSQRSSSEYAGSASMGMRRLRTSVLCAAATMRAVSQIGGALSAGKFG